MLAEAARRFGPPPDLIATAFGQQRDFLADTCRFKAALCTRRAGKSYGIGLQLVSEALAHPGASFVFMALTRLSAKRILHKDILRPICAQFGIAARFNETTGDVTFHNGSVVYLLGGDSTSDEADKVLGAKLRGAVVDESASFRQDLEEIVRAKIRPALVDLRGWLALIGTPGNRKGFFWRVTTGQVKGWSVHRWAAKDNPHIAEQWAEELAQLIAENPRIQETPLFRQHYLGEWAIDPTMLCYKYDATRNDVAVLPKGKGWRYVMGIDLGYEDDSAIVVGAYREHDKTLFIVYAEKRPNVIISAMAAWIRAVAERFPVHCMVVDGAAKQSVEELRQRHELPLEAAEKTGKSDAIDMMSSDLITERVKLLPAANELALEWGDLVWDEKALEKGRRVEHPNCPNHLADAGLYMWRKATNYAAEPPPEKRKRPATDEEVLREEDEEAEQMRRDEQVPWWERDAAA